MWLDIRTKSDEEPRTTPPHHRHRELQEGTADRYIFWIIDVVYSTAGLTQEARKLAQICFCGDDHD